MKTSYSPAPRPCIFLLGFVVACGGAERTQEADAGTEGSTTSSTAADGLASTTGDADAKTSTSGDESSTPRPECMGPEDCPEPSAPICDLTLDRCMSCSAYEPAANTACAQQHPSTPLCVAGACVQCTSENPVVCDAQRLLCDGETNACIPCTSHEQCGSGACELAVGTCFPPGTVVHVDGDEEPLPSLEAEALNAAVAELPAGSHGVIVVHEREMGQAYSSVVLAEGKIVTLLAAAGEDPIVQGFGGNSGIRVEGDGTAVYMDGLQVRGSNGPGLHVNGALAWADRSRIVQNTGGGVLAENGAELTLRNCFVGGEDSTAAVDVDGSTARITYSTLGGGTINAAGLSCTAPNTVEVRSSIIVALGIMATGGFDVVCPAADITYTATEMAFGGMGNVAVGDLPFMTPGDWFVNYGTGDFHLQNDGLTLFDNVAQWQSGDPPTDIDGDSRPAVEGSADYAGADVP